MSLRAAWVRSTMALDADMDRARQDYVESEYLSRGYTGQNERGRQEFACRRAAYVAGIISAWWKCCAPVTPTTCVPRSVAECIAEEWDERTKWRAA